MPDFMYKGKRGWNRVMSKSGSFGQSCQVCFYVILHWWVNQHQQSRIMSTIWWDSIGGSTVTQLISIPHHPLVIYLLWQTHPYGTRGKELRIPRLFSSVPVLILYPRCPSSICRSGTSPLAKTRGAARSRPRRLSTFSVADRNKEFSKPAIHQKAK